MHTLALAVEISPPRTIIHDTVWEGHITITHDVRMIGATVRVQPGSTIQFLGPPSAALGPQIQLASPSVIGTQDVASATLIFDGTPERPIVVETPEGRSPGAIVAGAATRGSIVARHTVFRRLGQPLSDQLANPALHLQLTAPDNDLWLDHCRFENCGPVRGEFLGPGASTHIEACHFVNTVGRTTVVLTGVGSGLKVITGNIADASFRIECAQVTMENNVLIGDWASISIPTPHPRAVSIIDNYIHCTTTEDSGRYVLKCETPDAIVNRNVFIGGTYVIETPPRTIQWNVLVGVTGLQAKFDIQGLKTQLRGSTTSTHYLISNLPPGAVITDNYFIGPAYAAIATSKRADQPRIEHNLFDGWETARRAVHFNMLADKALRAVFTDNVVTRYQMPPIYDDAGNPNTLAQVGRNIFANVPQPVYENLPTVNERASDDRLVEAFSDLKLASGDQRLLADRLDEQLTSRHMTISQARDRWLTTYRPHPDSPLAPVNPTGPGPRPCAASPKQESSE